MIVFLVVMYIVVILKVSMLFRVHVFGIPFVRIEVLEWMFLVVFGVVMRFFSCTQQTAIIAMLNVNLRKLESHCNV